MMWRHAVLANSGLETWSRKRVALTLRSPCHSIHAGRDLANEIKLYRKPTAAETARIHRVITLISRWLSLQKHLHLQWVHQSDSRQSLELKLVVHQGSRPLFLVHMLGTSLHHPLDCLNQLHCPCRISAPVRAKYGDESQFFDLDVSGRTASPFGVTLPFSPTRCC